MASTAVSFRRLFLLGAAAKILAVKEGTSTHLALVSTSPTFNEQLLRQKITNPNCKRIKAVQKTFVQKTAHKILVKLTPAVLTARLPDPTRLPDLARLPDLTCLPYLLQ